MFVKFLEIYNNTEMTINTNNIIFINHYIGARFIFPEKEETKLMDNPAFSSGYYSLDTRKIKNYPDNDKVCLIFCSNIRLNGYDFDNLYNTYENIAKYYKNMSIHKEPVYEIITISGHSFYCNEEGYKAICNNEILTIEK